MTLQQLEENIERRKAALGLTGNNYVRRNSGLNRTPE